MSKLDKLNIHESLLNEVKILQNILSNYCVSNDTKTYSIYLFGSFVSRCVSLTSDIDLLLLVDDCTKSKRDIQKMKWELEEYLESNFYNRQVDLKAYNKEQFHQLSNIENSFEHCINSYMIQLL